MDGAGPGAGPRRGRRHRRPFVPGRGARRSAGTSAASRFISPPTGARRAMAAPFADDAVHVVASATLRGAQSDRAWREPRAMLGFGVFQGLRADRPAQARGRDRLWRLSDDSAGAGGGLARRSDADPRRQRGHRACQSAVGAARYRNRHLVPRSVRDKAATLAAKATLTGNPVRPAVVAAAATPYPAPADPLRLLIFGGSQGARVMADVVPAAIELLEPELRARLAIVQQARDGGFGPGAGRLWQTAVAAEVAPFFSDLPARMAASHLIVVALRRLDRRRAFGHRPARDPGAAAACARSGPIRQCRRAGKGRRRHSAGRRIDFHAAAACRRDRSTRGGAAAPRRHGGGGTIFGQARCRRPARRPGAQGGGERAQTSRSYRGLSVCDRVPDKEPA